MKHKDTIIRLLLEGKTYREIILETGASKSTINHHARKLGNPNKRDYSPETSRASEMILDGARNAQIRSETGLSFSTICKLRREQEHPSNPKIFDQWDDLQAFYDAGASIKECCAHFGVAKKTLWRAKDQNLFKTRPVPEPYPLAEVMVENSTYQRGNLKRRLIADEILVNECAVCHAPPEWQGKPLVLVIDHINGVNNDNRLENLRLLCPNCNSQTDTFSGRNRKRNSQKNQI